MTESLVIHPDRLEDVGQKLANALMDCGLISMEESAYDKAISVIMRSLQPPRPDWRPETKRFVEYSSYGLIESEVLLIESRCGA